MRDDDHSEFFIQQRVMVLREVEWTLRHFFPEFYEDDDE